MILPSAFRWPKGRRERLVVIGVAEGRYAVVRHSSDSLTTISNTSRIFATNSPEATKWLQESQPIFAFSIRLRLKIGRHPHGEGAALSHLALHADRPAEQFREFLCDGQPQPGPLLDAALSDPSA